MDKRLIMSSKPWRSITVRPAGKEEVEMYLSDAGANFVGEVDYVGKLSLGDNVAVKMCEDPDWHEGFLAEWDVEKARAS